MPSTFSSLHYWFNSSQIKCVYAFDGLLSYVGTSTTKNTPDHSQPANKASYCHTVSAETYAIKATAISPSGIVLCTIRRHATTRVELKLN